MVNIKDQIKDARAAYLVDESFLTSNHTSESANPVPAGHKQTEVGIIPEDWQIKSLGEFAPLQRGFDLPNSLRTDGVYPVVYSNGIVNYHNKAMAHGPGVVTGRSGTLGKVHYVNADYWPHNTALWVTKFDLAQPKFVYYLFQHIGFERFASGSGVPTLNRNDAHAFKVAVPSKKEQCAISNVLSDVDALIQSLEALITKKQSIKTATMQQLLTGRTRLPQFAHRPDGMLKGTKHSELGEIPEDWKTDILGHLCGYQNGTAQESLFNSHGGFKVISIGNYSENGKYIASNIYISELLKPLVSKFLLNKGDLAMILNDKTSVGTIIGRAILIDSNDTYVINQRTMRLVPKNEVSPVYLHNLINSNFIHKKIVGLAKPGTQIYINTDDVLTLFLAYPSEKKEQNAIADILTDMDEEIQTHEQRLAKTRQLKQGMMQELLTGKTRLM